MPIELECSGCGKTLRVPDEHAGKQARCPGCKTVLTVPSPPHDFAPLPSENFPPDSGTSWHVRTADGQSYGPIDGAELQRWIREGRVAADAQVRREGETQWQWASSLFPALAGQPAAAASDNPFAFLGSDDGTKSVTERRRVKPHRGTLLLTFAIIGLVCCGFFSIAAWAMAQGDLAEIRSGRMDRRGEGITQASWIMGIIGTALLVLGFFAGFFVTLAGI
jgi:hypothetical protein